MRTRALLLGALVGLILGGLLVALLREPLARLLSRGPDPATIADTSLRAVQAQNRLTALAARFTVVVTSEQSRLGGVLSARKTIIVPGTVRYELDWNRVGRDDLAWDAATRTLTVRIPPPVIAGPEIDLRRIREFSDGRLLFALTDAEGELDTANRARVQQALLAEAQAPVLLAMAREATTAAVARTFALPLAAAGVDATVRVTVTG